MVGCKAAILEEPCLAGALTQVAVAAPGSGYAANDVLTVATGTGGKVQVVSVDGDGGVTLVSVTEATLSLGINTSVANSVPEKLTA